MSFCQCGCGRPTRIVTRTDTAKGLVKGQSRPFAVGHNTRTGHSVRYLSKLSDGKLKWAHVVVAEIALGKALPRGAQIHHVDENKQNNKPSNLVICQDGAYHQLLHVRSRVVRAGGNPNTQRICSLCQNLTAIENLTGKKPLQPYRAIQCRPCARVRQRIAYARGRRA